MELSEEKTLITHSSGCARFLGYDVRVRRCAAIKHGGPGNKTKRTLNNSCELAVPLDDKIHKFIFANKIAIQKPDGKLMPVTVHLFCVSQIWKSYLPTMQNCGEFATTMG